MIKVSTAGVSKLEGDHLFRPVALVSSIALLVLLRVCITADLNPATPFFPALQLIILSHHCIKSYGFKDQCHVHHYNCCTKQSFLGGVGSGF